MEVHNVNETCEAKFCFFICAVKYKLALTVASGRCADPSFLYKKGQKFVYEFLN